MALTIYAEFQPLPAGSTTIAVVGLGYIGLPTAAALARAGSTVIGVDIDRRAVDAAKSHIVEPGLDNLLSEVVGSGALRADTVMPEADAYLIAVPTPVGHDQYRTPDLSYVFAAADAVARVLKPGALVVLESTSPVGATRQMIARMAAARPDLRFPQDGRDEDQIVKRGERGR